MLRFQGAYAKPPFRIVSEVCKDGADAVVDVDNSCVIYIYIYIYIYNPITIERRGLGAVRSGGNSALVLHSMVSLCNVVVCCLSMGCGLEEAVSSAGSIFTARVRLNRGSRVPGM